MINIKKYFLERITPSVLGLIFLLLLTDIHRSFISQLLIVILIICFRLLDDLLDLKWDRVQHPQRLLVNLKNFRSVYLTLSFLILIIFLLLKLYHFMLFVILTFIWSIIMFKIPFEKRMLKTTISLLKYPIVLFLTSSFSIFWGKSFLIYFGVFIYDLLDDKNQNSNKILSMLAPLLVLWGFFISQNHLTHFYIGIVLAFIAVILKHQKYAGIAFSLAIIIFSQA